MSDLRISAADYTDMTNQVENFSVDSAQAECMSYTPDWLKWKGYYDTIPELQATIDKKAIWTVGKGFQADEKTKEKLFKIRGCGVDTFNTIMQNMVRCYTICGDAFAEIVKNKRNELINLKPLPCDLTINATKFGIISDYTQKIDGETIYWKPKEIFHLAWMRLGSAIHGTGTIAKVEQIVLMRNEAMTDMQLVFHRYVKPLLITEANTDDPTELAALKVKQDKAVALGENMIIAKGSMAMQRISIPQYSTLDPLPWIQLLNRYFIMAEGVPEVILGSGTETTEATSKILYLGFQQTVEINQLFLEEQLKAQLDIEVEFNFPISLEQELQKDQKKDGKSLVKKSDVKA